jgi:hypothetical protein
MHNYYSYFQNMPAMDPLFGGFIATAGLWTLAWKGWALWLAARRNENIWFIALLLINTLGILEIIYIFAIAKRSDKEVVKSDTQEAK